MSDRRSFDDLRLTHTYRQVLPRPANASVHAVPLAPFVRWDATERSRLCTLEHVEAAFAERGSEPGLPTGANRRPRSTGAGAAVLVPLLSSREGGAASVALIRRARHLRSNPGEIAFPGGRIEPGESEVEAALREAEEEVAMERASVRVLGSLPTVERAARPLPIAVVIGVVDGVPRLRPNPDEVDAVLVVRLDELADPEGYWEESWLRADGQEWRMPMFDLGEDVIWGASARILVLLFERIAGVASSQEQSD